jgi:ornithine cyclodeaminase/alanine dehydrogenase-like protein (mu-crystallin family)
MNASAAARPLAAGLIEPMYISENEVRSLLTYDSLIPAIRQALIDYSAGLVDQPARMMMRAGNAEGNMNGWFAVMPVVAGDVMAVKTVTFYPGNAEKGLHTHTAVIELLRRSTGEPLAIMDGRLITEMRTAAVSAVALGALASDKAASLGILGSGVQARSHIQAFRMVRGFKDIRIWSRNPANAGRLAEQTAGRAVPIEEAAAADVVLTVTASPEPVLEGRWLSPHALVLAIGATGPSLRELDDEVMRTSFVVAESRSCVERESGDVRLSGAKVDAEIGEILAGSAAAPSNGRMVFKSVGMGIEDLTAARLVWQAFSNILK